MLNINLLQKDDFLYRLDLTIIVHTKNARARTVFSYIPVYLAPLILPRPY